ncbi:MAG: M15 family metallopeptidase [Candidatus Sumerlaeota bacterium]
MRCTKRWYRGAVDRVKPWPEPEAPDLVDPTTLDSSILVDHQWSRENPLFDAPLFKRQRIVLRRPVAEALVRVNKRLYEQGYRLKLFDGYRPFWITQLLWSRHKAAAYLAAPSLGSRHNRASAVDCTIVRLDGSEVEMPSPSLAFDKSSHRDYEDMAPHVRENVLTLTRAMQAEGWGIIYSEWWHFDAPGWEQYDVLNVPLWDDEESLAIEDSQRTSMLLPPALPENEDALGENDPPPKSDAPPVPDFFETPDSEDLSPSTATESNIPARSALESTPALPQPLAATTTQNAVPAALTPDVVSGRTTGSLTTEDIVEENPTLSDELVEAETESPMNPEPFKPGRLLVYLGLALVLAGSLLLFISRKK